MAYTAWSVVFGEQPSAAKWNILGTNDSSFNDGTGIGTNAIAGASLKADAITLGYASATTDQLGITTITDLTSLTTTVTVPAGSRYIEVHGSVNVNGTAANLAGLRILEGTTVLGVCRQPTNGTGGWSNRLDVWYRAVVSAGSHTYKLSLTLDAGTGSVGAYATDPSVSSVYGRNFIQVSAY